MGDNAADDDDYTFGDFTFASFPSSNSNPTVNSHHPSINGPKLTPISTNRVNNDAENDDDDDDDEWGDFVTSPIRSDNHHHQFSNAASHTQSKPLDDPFAFSSGSDKDVNLKKKGDWEKPKGPLPMSLFGGDEEDEDKVVEEERSSVNYPQAGYGKESPSNVRNGSGNVNLNVGLNDVIANLYSFSSNQLIKAENGFISDQSTGKLDAKGVNLNEKNSISNLNELSLSSASVDVNKDVVNKDQKSINEDEFRFSSNGLASSPSTDASSLSTGGWSVNNFSGGSLGSSSILNDQSKPNKGENKVIDNDMSRLNSNQNASSSNLSASGSDFGGWSFDFGGFSSGANMSSANFNASSSNFNGASSNSRNEEKYNGNEDDNVDDNDGWEFKGAFTEAKAIDEVDQAGPRTREMNTNSPGFRGGSNGSNDIFSFSDGSFDLFSMSNGVSSDSGKAGSEFNIKPATAAQVSFSSDKATGMNSGLDFHQVVQGAEDDEDFGDFTAAFPETGLKKEGELKANDISVAETEANTSIGKEQVKVAAKVHDVSQLNAYASSSGKGTSRTVDLFAFSDEPIDFFAMSNGVSGASLDFDSMPSTAAPSGLISHTNLNNERVDSIGGLDPHSVLESGENDDDFGDFSAAFPESEQKQEGDLLSNQPQSELEAMVSDGKDLAKETRFENRKGALPLSIFGDEELEVDNTLNSQDAFLHSPSPVQRNGRSPSSVISIDDLISNLYSQAEQNSVTDTSRGTTDIEASATAGISSDLLNDDDDFDDGSWEFKDASAPERAENEMSPSNREEGNTDIEVSATTGINSVLLNDVDDFDDGSWEFKDVFAQERAENKKSPSNHEDGNTYIKASATTGINSNLLNDADNFDGGSWEFKDAFARERAENEKSHSNHEVGTTNIEVSVSKGINFDLLNDFDGGSWEFNDALAQERVENENSLGSPEDAHLGSAFEVGLNNYIVFYSKLKDGLGFVIKCHLENLKKAQSTPNLSGEDDKSTALDEELEEILKEVDQETVISQEDSSEGHQTIDSSLNEFLEALHDHKFQVLESEYGLRQKLSSAEKDLRSALELKKHVTTMLKILRLGSAEDHLTYISIWSKMISVCAQELQSGTNIWKLSLERNVLDELLSEPQGKKFIQALGEIYRVAMLIGASLKLYKPWTFDSSAESSRIFALVDKCDSVWSASGIREALSDISHSTSIDENSHFALLAESIQYIRDLDFLTLQDHVHSQQESICQLSLLSSESISGMKVVAWNGKQYFVKLANLWANLINSDPPTVPNLHLFVDAKVG